MGLKERLEAARQERAARGGAVVNLRDVADTTEKPAAPAQEWGRPGVCPDCGSAGYLDRVDMINRVMHQHCTACGKAWEISEAELLA